ncbi:STAS domain-containing protein [Embleya scabrispora]|uniref:STAS domain-containing protein n=1 Tax=Embleya scabrispora TaxID=159449 RepID=UPI001F46DE4A|nr:STAS domain-containing protein [Embleya scabrispora]
MLLVTLPDGLDDDRAAALAEDVAAAVAGGAAGGVIIDVGAAEILDSLSARVLADTAACVKLMAADTVIAGIRPAVAITMVDLGLNLPGLRTALTVEDAFASLGPAGEAPVGPVRAVAGFPEAPS